MSKKSIIVVIVLLMVVIALALVAYFVRTTALKEAANEANKTLFSEDSKAQFLDINSKPVSLSAYEDKILVVNVWASWSPYTEIEFPILNELASTYKDRGVHFLVLNRKESQVQIERYLASLPSYDNLEKIIDVNDFFYAGVDGYAMPETLIYDQNGVIIQHIRGVVKKDELATALDQLLAED
jgi:thiol-disulfide isomerase/thioredoxin